LLHYYAFAALAFYYSALGSFFLQLENIKANLAEKIYLMFEDKIKKIHLDAWRLIRLLNR
jgi:hypothetical protein